MLQRGTVMAWLALTTATVGRDLARTDPLVLLEQCPLPLAVVDLTAGSLVRSNPAFAMELGLEGSTAGVQMRGIVPAGSELEPVIELLQSGGLDTVEASCVLQRRDGSSLQAVNWFSIVDTRRRERALWVLVSEDVALRPLPPPSRSRWPRAIDGAIIGVLDEALRVAQVSQGVARTLGFRRTEVLGHPATGFVHRDDVPVLLSSVAHALAERAGIATELRIRDHDDRWRHMHVMLAPLASDDVQIGYTLVPIVVAEQNVAARIQALEQRLRRIGGEVEASGVPVGVAGVEGVTSSRRATARHLPELADLSPRQWEVLDRLQRGERVPGIARRLFLSQSTVRNHLTGIYRRLGVNSQEELLDILRAPPDPPS